MRSSVFLTEDLSKDDLEKIEGIALAVDASFTNLVKIGEFNPAVDFRHADLRGMDFEGADLRGFDFTGADLRDVSGSCILDASTILEGAQLDGSIFLRTREGEMGIEYEVYQSLKGSHWTNQVIVLERELQRQDLAISSKLATASALYAMGKDSFIRRTAMRAMSKLMTIDDFLAFIRTQLVSGNHSPIEVLGAALHNIDELYATAPAECLRFLVELLRRDETFATNAAGSIARNLRLQDVPRMSSYIKRAYAPVVRRSFIASFAARLSPVHAMIVRDPISGDIFDFDTILTESEFNDVVRAVARRVRTESADRTTSPKPVSEILGFPHNEKAVAASVRTLYRDLSLIGGPSIRM